MECIGLKVGNLKDDDFIRSYFPAPKEYEQFVANGRAGKRDPGPIANYIWD